MAFQGFGDGTVDFYEGLEADNSKAYWTDNAELYNEHVRKPMEALLAELADEFGTGKVFRPYRDVRFAKDKSPYKVHCGAVIELGRGGGAYYVEVSANGMRIGGGSYHMASDQLARYRTAVDDDRRGKQLEKIIAELARRGWTIDGDVMASKPRGCPPDHPRLDLMRHRSIVGMRAWEPDDTMHSRRCLTRVRKGWQELRPINDWAADHIGVSDKPRR